MKLIYETLVGSRLYNLHTSGSDVDLKGIYLCSKEQLLGLDNDAREHVVNGETTHYAFAKFISLCLKLNPTVLELCFVQDKYKTVTSPVAEEILKFVRENMISRKVFYPYYGYIKDQLKIVIAKKATNNRGEMIAKHGYDIKASSHVYRLARQAESLLLNGYCDPTMLGSEREICFAIKNGKYSFEECMQILTQEFELFESLKDQSPLKEDIDYEKVNNFVITIHEGIVKGII
jgi:uncharacterized protein